MVYGLWVFLAFDLFLLGFSYHPWFFDCQACPRLVPPLYNPLFVLGGRSVFAGNQRDNMPLLALGHKMALSLLTLMLGSALATKPRATKSDAIAMIRSLGFGFDRNARPQPVNSEAVKLIKRGPEYDRLKRKYSDETDAIDEALIALEINGYIALPADYPLLNVECCTLDEIENRGVPEHIHGTAASPMWTKANTKKGDA